MDITDEQRKAIENLTVWVARWREENPGKAAPAVIFAAEHAIETFGGPTPAWRKKKD